MSVSVTEPRYRTAEMAATAVSVAAGLWVRLYLAARNYLNPDEALHGLIAMAPWRDAVRYVLYDGHPPFLILFTHFVCNVSHSEIALRIAPVLAGSLFPVLFSMWVRRFAGSAGALAVLILLTFAPHLISVSAQMRGYTLALLFISASLLVLEAALDRARPALMVTYNLLLWLAIVSDYSVAWFAGAASLYGILRLRGASNPVKIAWLAGQIAAVVTFGFLVYLQVRNFGGGAMEARAIGSWLKGGYPEAGNVFTFPFVNTLKQFAYLLASIPVGAAGLAAFAVAIFWLWTSRTVVPRDKGRALAVLLVTPFVLGILGAYAHVFPYGRSRHTLSIDIFGAAGIAIFIANLRPRVANALVAAMLVLTPVWYWKADIDPQDMAADRTSRQLMIDGLNYMHATIPANSLIFTQWDTLVMLIYYQDDGRVQAVDFIKKESPEVSLGGWRFTAQNYKYRTPGEYAAGMAALRRQYALSDHQPVWVVQGGWDIVTPHEPKLPFAKAVRVFQDPVR